MKNVEYLYGEDVNTKVWETMLYSDVLTLKIKLAYDNITELYKIHFMHRDTVHINDCSSAMSFNEKLLKEMK